MKNKILFIMLFMFSATVAMAQSDIHKMSETQKTQSAKADVYIINSKKKLMDSFTTAVRDTVISNKKSKKQYCLKRNKKSS